jgi:hypothetical protein
VVVRQVLQMLELFNSDDILLPRALLIGTNNVADYRDRNGVVLLNGLQVRERTTCLSSEPGPLRAH